MKNLIFLALPLLLTSCTELITEIPDDGNPTPTVFNDNPIMYCGMEVGQKSTYENLNISIQNAIMAVDGPGTTYIYSNLNGMVRTSHYSWWTQSGFGWDLLGSD